MENNQCSIEGCEKPIRCKGLCKAHHLRQWRHGSPMLGGPSRGHARKFLLSHIDHESDECLIWPFCRNKTGYGEITWTKHDTKLVHRIMCRLAHGSPPTKNHEAAHSCGKGHMGCFNPRHLSWKTGLDNCRDKALHGTQQWGDQIHFAKLTLEQAKRIKHGSENGRKLAFEMGVRPETIYNIRSGRTWKGI